MARTLLFTSLIIFAHCGTYAQLSAPLLSFEVASVKPSPPPGATGLRITANGGPGTSDPGRFTARNTSLYNLILQAYDIKPYQIICPDWLLMARFDIDAKVPAGTTHKQFLTMLQNLLAERFKLRLHRDKKEMQAYDLVIGKGGLKLKKSVESSAPKPGAPPPDPSKVSSGADGYPVFLPGSPLTMIANGSDGRRGMRMLGESMDTFVTELTKMVGRPITDQTGLKGKYDFALRWAPSGAPVGETEPDLFQALQTQLGLNLQSTKGLVDVLVVDHAEKVPTEN